MRSGNETTGLRWQVGYQKPYSVRVGMNVHSNGIEQEMARTCKDDAQHLDVHLHTSWEQLSPRSRSPLETAISTEETEDDETRPLISKKIEEKRKGIKII